MTLPILPIFIVNAPIPTPNTPHVSLTILEYESEEEFYDV